MTTDHLRVALDLVTSHLDRVPTRWLLLLAFAASGVLGSVDWSLLVRVPLLCVSLPVLGYAVVRLVRERGEG